MSDSENKETFSDSSDQLTEDEWILYRDRPEWKDVEPVELKEGPLPVVAIAYSDRCMYLLNLCLNSWSMFLIFIFSKVRDVFNYFRAIALKNEMSERAFHLTSDALDLNPANYTVWQYRYCIIKTLSYFLINNYNYISGEYC